MSAASQVEIGNCVTETEQRVDQVLAATLEIAQASAASLDEVTGRATSVPALGASQAAWEAFRDAQCAFVGETFGGGSGTGIAISSCRVDLTRTRIETLLSLSN